MKKSIKALLWSGLAFPGTGHFYLKLYSRGLILFVPALVSMCLYLRGLMMQLEFVWDQLESGTMTPDPVAIAELLDKVPQAQVTDIAFWVFALCWVGGMLDSYLLGAKMDEEAAGASNKPR